MPDGTKSTSLSYKGSESSGIVILESSLYSKDVGPVAAGESNVTNICRLVKSAVMPEFLVPDMECD